MWKCVRDVVHLNYQDVYQSEYKVVLFRLDCHIYTCMLYTIHMYVKLWPWHLPYLPTPTHLSPWSAICFIFWWHLYILVYILCMILNFLWYDSAVRREHLLMYVCHHCSIYSEALLSHHIECCTIIAICSLFTNLL